MMKIPLIHKCRAPTKRRVYEVSFKIILIAKKKIYIYIYIYLYDRYDRLQEWMLVRSIYIYIYIYMVQQIDYTPGSTPSIFEWRYATVNPITEHVQVHFVIFILD